MKTLKYADWNIVNDLATKQVGKYSVYISNGLVFDSDEDDIVWNFLLIELTKMFGDKTPEFFDYVGNIIHGGLFFFDTEVKATEFYKIFDQELTQSSSIYATLNCPIHGCMTENT